MGDVLAEALLGVVPVQAGGPEIAREVEELAGLRAGERARRAAGDGVVERLSVELAAGRERVSRLEAALRRVSAVHGQALGPILGEVAS